MVGRRRRRLGPVILRPALRAARHCHDVWTVDFKGLYRTADGLRVEPLTVRDLYSRYGLRVALLRRRDLEQTRNQFVQIFRQYGLPRRIRCDNGTPFGAGGPTGLTRLSAWWVKLGIRVEFITPGRPCHNGAHEQFHRVYPAAVVPHAQRPLNTQHTENKRLFSLLHALRVLRATSSLYFGSCALQKFHAGRVKPTQTLDSIFARNRGDYSKSSGTVRRDAHCRRWPMVC